MGICCSQTSMTGVGAERRIAPVFIPRRMHLKGTKNCLVMEGSLSSTFRYFYILKHESQTLLSAVTSRINFNLGLFFWLLPFAALT